MQTLKCRIICWCGPSKGFVLKFGKKKKGAENSGRYRSTSEEDKKAVGDAESKAFEDTYKKLEMKGGERNIYKLSKTRDIRTNVPTSYSALRWKISSLS